MDSKDLQVIFSHNSDEWTTPQYVFDYWNTRIKRHKNIGYDLDAAASDHNTLCENYFTEGNSALTNDWWGRVWCNPPYSMCYEFVEKAHYEAFENKHVELVTLLLPARTDTKWFHEFIPDAFSIAFIKGRLKFSASKNSAPFPSMIVNFIKDGQGRHAIEFLTKKEMGYVKSV